MKKKSSTYTYIVELRFNPYLCGSLTKSLKQHCITSDTKAAREEKDRQRGDKCMNLHLVLTNIHIKYMFLTKARKKSWNMHCTENLKPIIPEMKLCDLVFNFYIHVSWSDLYIHSIGLT
jgi:hypothetical protein